MLAGDDIIDEIGGDYKYYCYVLAEFDPKKAKELMNDCSIEDITLAMMARYNHYNTDDN